MATRTHTHGRDPIAGAVLGAAIGDAMGHPTEFMSVEAIRAQHGPDGVTGFVLHWTRDGKRFAPYTDDTQMAEIVARCLVATLDETLDFESTMRRMARSFAEWAERPQGGHRAPGRACLEGCRALAAGAHWSEAGGPNAGGCGSVMRAYPFGLVFARDPERAEHWAVEHSKMTHRDPIALAACAAMARGVAAAVKGAGTEAVLDEMPRAAGRYSAATAMLISGAIEDARGGVPPVVTLDRLRGWAAHEAIAGAAYVFARHAHDPRAAILEAANTPGDSDSLATLAGALVGAGCGLRALPEEWIAGVERSDELLALAAALEERTGCTDGAGE